MFFESEWWMNLLATYVYNFFLRSKLICHWLAGLDSLKYGDKIIWSSNSIDDYNCALKRNELTSYIVFFSCKKMVDTNWFCSGEKFKSKVRLGWLRQNRKYLSIHILLNCWCYRKWQR